GAGPDRRGALEQADRARARHRREDRQDTRRSPAGQARCRRSHPGRPARRSQRPRARVLRPITASKRDRLALSVTVMPTAIITGASRGLGLALARELAHHHWRLVIDARGEHDLVRAATELGQETEVVAIP